MSTVTDKLDGIQSSLAVKAPVIAATTANITLSGVQTIEGVAVVTNDRVLVRAQTSKIENGIYDVRTGAWKRSPDFDGNRDVADGTLVVLPRASGAGVFYQVQATNPIKIGTTPIDFFLKDDPNITYPLTAAEIAEGLTVDDIVDSYPEYDARRYGVLADSDGTTGNGADDAAAWINAIAVAKQGGGRLIGPPGISRIGSVLEMNQLIGEFHGLFFKDFDGTGITITEGGSTFTELTDIKIAGLVASESITSHGIDVIDSRVHFWGYCRSFSHGGIGYQHTDDDGNSNHSIIEMDCDLNGSHGFYFKDGPGVGGNCNNWTIRLGAFQNVGDGLRIDADCKYMRGVFQAQQNTLIGLNLDAGSSITLEVYLESNVIEDYNFAAAMDHVEVRGRLGSGTDSSTSQRVKLMTGGNQDLLKGNTPMWRQAAANNVSDSGAEYIRDEWTGSSAEKLFEQRVYGNSDWKLAAWNRSGGIEESSLYCDTSQGKFIFSDGTDDVNLYAGAFTARSLNTATTAQLQDVGHLVNTHAAKVEGACIFDTTANIPMYSTGAADASTWKGEKAGATITLSPV